MFAARPSVTRYEHLVDLVQYGRQTGANDYIFSFRIYSQHEMEEQLEPHEFAERKKARARFKTARLFVGFPCAFFVDADDHV